jgi:hypothetical protein
MSISSNTVTNLSDLLVYMLAAPLVETCQHSILGGAGAEHKTSLSGGQNARIISF